MGTCVHVHTPALAGVPAALVALYSVAKANVREDLATARLLPLLRWYVLKLEMCGFVS